MLPLTKNEKMAREIGDRFDRVQDHNVSPAVRKPPVAQRNQQQPNAKSVSVSDRVKTWGQLKPLFRSLKANSHKSRHNGGVRPPAPSTPPPLPPYPTDLPPDLPRTPNGEEFGICQDLSPCPPLPPRPDDLQELDTLWLPPPPCDLVITNVANGDDEIYDDGSSVEPMHPLSIYPWFHEDATKENSDMRVKRIGQEGAFLIRKSSQKDSYTLVVYSGNDTYNMLIALRKDGKYAIGKEKTDEKRFESVADFINHHLQYKITLSKGGSVVLSKPVPRP